MGDDDICRFCFDREDPTNPLIDPCNCIGSAKYVHVHCLRQWRLHTTNHEWANKCQLCLAEYALYLRWQREQNPIISNFVYMLVDKHYAITILMYYLHLAYLSFYPPLYKKSIVYSTAFGSLNPFDTSTIAIPINVYSELESLYLTSFSYNVYLVLLALITTLYITTYYVSFWKNIRNKKLYISFWFSCITEGGMFQTPLMTLFMLVMSAVLSIQYIAPFAFLYVYTLASIFHIHMTIIRQMNADAEIY